MPSSPFRTDSEIHTRLMNGPRRGGCGAAQSARPGAGAARRADDVDDRVVRCRSRGRRASARRGRTGGRAASGSVPPLRGGGRRPRGPTLSGPGLQVMHRCRKDTDGEARGGRPLRLPHGVATTLQGGHRRSPGMDDLDLRGNDHARGRPRAPGPPRQGALERDGPRPLTGCRGSARNLTLLSVAGSTRFPTLSCPGPQVRRRCRRVIS